MAALQRPSQGETQYFAVFMGGKKVGYAAETRTVADGNVATTEKVSITLSRAAIPVTMDVSETCLETTDGKPLGFESVQNIGLFTIKCSGTVDEHGIMNLLTASMGSENKTTTKWPPDAVMAEGLRLMTLKKGLVEGSEYSVKVFSPGILQAIDAKITVGPKQNVDLLGRVVPLTKVTNSFNMPGAGEFVTTEYLDDKLQSQKMVMPFAGLTQIELIACPKDFALAKNDVFELIDKMFLASPTPLHNPDSAKSITYYLSPTPGANDLYIPSTDNQSVRAGKDGTLIVTVSPAGLPKGAALPYKGKDTKILEATKPTRFLQSDRKKIIELAHSAVGNTKDAAEAAKKIETFVAGYIQNKTLSVGYASAAEVAESRQGDCSEFALLTAAMCRAVAIPARVTVGLAYVKDFAGMKGFGPHAWVEAYLGDRWVGLDAAFISSGLGGYGPGHITLALGNGNPSDFFNLITTLGRFRIDKVVVNKAK